MRALEVIHITWVDSEALSEWTLVQDLPDQFKVIHTVGFLIHQTADMYTIACSYDPDLDSINAAISIPTRCVVSVATISAINIGESYGD